VISVDFSNSQLADIVDSLAKAADIAVDTEVIKQGTVNLKWESVSAREALDMVLKMNRLALQESNGKYQIISTIEGENPVLMDPPPPSAAPKSNPVITAAVKEFHEHVMKEWQVIGLSTKLNGAENTTPTAPSSIEGYDSTR
jgi:hypothetical protein